MYSFLATTSADTTVNIWQTADFSLKKTLKETNQRWVWDCAFSEDSQYLITGTCMIIIQMLKVPGDDFRVKGMIRITGKKRSVLVQLRLW